MSNHQDIMDDKTKPKTRKPGEPGPALIARWKKILSGLHELPEHCRDGAIAHAVRNLKLKDEDLGELQMIAASWVYSGAERERTDAMWELLAPHVRECLNCQGRGEFPDHIICPVCRGAGFETERRVYDVPVKFIFAGVFKIQAESPTQAAEYAEKHCGLVLGGNIHSTLPEEDADWDFASHPEKIIGNSTQP